MGRSVSKIIIIILSLRLSTSKNKNIGHRDWGICDKWKQPHIFTPWFNDAKCMKFLLFIYFIATHIRVKINHKKNNVYARNQYYYHFNLPKIRVGRLQKTKLPVPNLHSNPIVTLRSGKVKHQIFSSELHQ